MSVEKKTTAQKRVFFKSEKNEKCAFSKSAQLMALTAASWHLALSRRGRMHYRCCCCCSRTD